MRGEKYKNLAPELILAGKNTYHPKKFTASPKFPKKLTARYTSISYTYEREAEAVVGVKGGWRGMGGMM